MMSVRKKQRLKAPVGNLSSSSRAKSSLEIFEADNLHHNISLSKSSSGLNEESKVPSNNPVYNPVDNNKPESDTNIKSVREQAKKLNRLNTQMELKQCSTPQKARKSSLDKEENLIPKHIDLENIDLADPDPNEKEWLLVCSRCEYMDIAKWLSKYPHFAQKRDPFTGYTCAHWACKYGHIEVLKLIASTLENDTKSNPKLIRIKHLINSRTRAGYTCLHIAYIFKHGDLAPILKTYGAEGLIDYSGKQAIDYSEKQENQFSRPQSYEISDSEVNRKSSHMDTGLDLSSIVKRTSSILMKDKEPKFMRPKTSTLQRHHDTTLSKSMLPPSPLAALEHCQNTNHKSSSIMPFLHPSIISRSKSRTINNDDIYQNDENISESKENIFI